MPKDSRLYANITHDFFESPKIMVLSPEAKLGLLEMILWSCRMRTDGVIDRRVASAKHLLDVCQELLDNDPDAPSLVELENGDFYIHDFAEHQTTRAEIEEIREKRRAAGRAGGLAKSRAHAAKSSKSLASAKASAKHGAKQTPSKALAKPLAKCSKKKKKKGEGEQVENTANAAAQNVPSTPKNLDELAAAHAARTRCPKHAHIPPGEWVGENCRECQKLREGAEAEDAREREAALRARRECDRCDANGMRYEGGKAWRCDHKPETGPKQGLASTQSDEQNTRGQSPQNNTPTRQRRKEPPF
ncbi:hypothetical protein [Corynebacterium macginleyi]|uniref:hypothetical protein n=1 Tax=Corynebacterium macginleyi TaxID=38290 RepID=UPI00307FF7A1